MTREFLADVAFIAMHILVGALLMAAFGNQQYIVCGLIAVLAFAAALLKQSRPVRVVRV